jgi:hypothetical protein
VDRVFPLNGQLVLLLHWLVGGCVKRRNRPRATARGHTDLKSPAGLQIKNWPASFLLVEACRCRNVLSAEINEMTKRCVCVFPSNSHNNNTNNK